MKISGMSDRPDFIDISDPAELPDVLRDLVKGMNVERMKKIQWPEYNRQLVIVVTEIGGNPASFKAFGASSLLDKETWEIRSPVTNHEPIPAQDKMFRDFDNTLG